MMLLRKTGMKINYLLTLGAVGLAVTSSASWAANRINLHDWDQNTMRATISTVFDDMDDPSAAACTANTGQCNVSIGFYEYLGGIRLAHATPNVRRTGSSQLLTQKYMRDAWVSDNPNGNARVFTVVNQLGDARNAKFMCLNYSDGVDFSSPGNGLCSPINFEANCTTTGDFDFDFGAMHKKTVNGTSMTKNITVTCTDDTVAKIHTFEYVSTDGIPIGLSNIYAKPSINNKAVDVAGTSVNLKKGANALPLEIELSSSAPKVGPFTKSFVVTVSVQ